MIDENADRKKYRRVDHPTRRNFLSFAQVTAVLTVLGGTAIGIQKLLEKNLSEDEVDRMLAQDEETSLNLTTEIARLEQSIAESMERKAKYEKKYGKQDSPMLRVNKDVGAIRLPSAPRTREATLDPTELESIMQEALILRDLIKSHRQHYRTTKVNLTPSLDALHAERSEKYLHQYPENGETIAITSTLNFIILVAKLAELERRTLKNKYSISLQILLAESEVRLRSMRGDLMTTATRVDVHQFGMTALQAVIAEVQNRFPEIVYYGNEDQLRTAKGGDTAIVSGAVGFHDASDDRISLHLNQPLIDALLTLWHESGHVIGRTAEMYEFKDIERKSRHHKQCKSLHAFIQERVMMLTQWKNNPHQRRELNSHIQNLSSNIDEIMKQIRATNVAEITGDVLGRLEEEGPMITASQLDESVAFLVQQLLIHEAFKNTPEILRAVQRRVAVMDETVTSKRHVGSYALAREVLEKCNGNIAEAIHTLADTAPDSPEFARYATRLRALTQERGGKSDITRITEEIQEDINIGKITIKSQEEASTLIQSISESNGLSGMPDEEKLRTEIGKREGELATKVKKLLDLLQKEYEANL